MHRKSSPFSWRISKENSKLVGNAEKFTGIVESFTTVHIAPKDFENNVPYALALIFLNNGQKIVSEIVDSKNISIGMKVEPCLRKIYADGDDGIVHYVTKFKAIK